MFRVHSPIISSIGCWFAAYGYLHRVFGWMVVWRAATWVVCTVQKTICCNTNANAPDDGRMYPKHFWAKNSLIKLGCCIKLAFQIISWGKCTVKQPSTLHVYLPNLFRFAAKRCEKIKYWNSREFDVLRIFINIWACAVSFLDDF